MGDFLQSFHASMLFDWRYQGFRVRFFFFFQKRFDDFQMCFSMGVSQLILIKNTFKKQPNPYQLFVDLLEEQSYAVLF
jgi:hypothetical protein